MFSLIEVPGKPGGFITLEYGQDAVPIVVPAFSFLLVQKRNKKGQPATIYGPLPAWYPELSSVHSDEGQ